MNSITFVDTVIKSSQVKGGNGQELILVEEGTKLIGKNAFKLGRNKDSVDIKASIKTLFIDNGKDNANDVIKVDSYGLISKKLLIKNFRKADLLEIEGDVFNYRSLNDKKINNALAELGIVVDTIGSN